MKASTNDIKTLNTFLNEQNEFKRFILCQLWISQLFTSTINSSITKALTQTKDTEPLSNSKIYVIFQDIKQQLKDENERLSLALNEMTKTVDLLHVINEVFGLNENITTNGNIDKLKHQIDENNVYIDKIDNLSEKQIEDIRNDHNVNRSNK